MKLVVVLGLAHINDLIVCNDPSDIIMSELASAMFSLSPTCHECLTMDIVAPKLKLLFASF
jgi:hypothetical protein